MSIDAKKPKRVAIVFEDKGLGQFGLFLEGDLENFQNKKPMGDLAKFEQIAAQSYQAIVASLTQAGVKQVTTQKPKPELVIPGAPA